MVLILSQQNDGSTVYVVKWLLYYKIPFIRIDRESHISVEKFELRSDGKYSFVIRVGNSNVIDLEGIRAFWYRRGELNFEKPNLEYIENRNLKYTVSRYLKKELFKVEELIYYLLNEKKHIGSFQCRDLNKIYVLMQARELNLNIPYTIVTTLKSQVCENLNYITKSISDPFTYEEDYGSYGSYTSKIDLENVPDSFFPALFQEEIKKEADIRIFYILGEFYSMAIMSQSHPQTQTDFRKYIVGKERNRNFPYKLPDCIEYKLDKLMCKLNLESGSIDMILTKSGEHLFLEINPIGQYDMVSGPCNYYLHRLIAKKLQQLNHS